MIILDTNVISELMKGNKCSANVFDWTSKQLITNLFTTTITQAEILYGIAILPQGKRRDELNKIAELIFKEDFSERILSFDQKAAVNFAQIASICYSQNAIIATRNVDDFKNCNVSIINPWEDQ